MGDERQLVRLEDEQDLEALRATASEYGLVVELTSVRDLGVGMAAFLVGAGAVVAAAIRSHAERRQGGQVIDLRPGAPLVRRDRGLQYGLILIVVGEGQIELRVWQPQDQLTAVVTDVLQALSATNGSSARAIGNVVAKAVGARGETIVHEEDASGTEG